MSSATASTTTAPGPRVLADVIPGGLARDIALVVGGAAFVGLSAQISVLTPLSPVPFTGQTFAVLLAASALGTVRGVLSMILYVAVGVAGVPWFAGASSGAGGASFGYLLGFVVAAAVVGAIADSGSTRSFLKTVGALAVGNAIIYAIGVPWLKYSLGVDWPQAIEFGITPFLLWDALKIFAAAGLLPGVWRLIRS